MSLSEKHWPASKVELRPLDRIIPYPRNAKRHPQEQVAALAADMKTDGVTMPILVDEGGVIIAGHGRLLAAQANGFERYPVVVAKGWSETQKKAARIKDNQRTFQSDWDREILRIELADLQIQQFDLSILGFDDKALASYLPAEEPKQNPNEIAEPPKKPIVRAGDLWTLGEHRILCGDSTDAKSWDRIMGRDVAAMTFTDPPYGVSYEAQGGEFDIIKGDDKRRDALYQMLLRSISLMAKHTSDRGATYIWHASSTRNDFAQAITAAGLTEKQYLIWAKPSMVLGRADYQWSHEPCFYCAHEGESPQFYGDRTGTTVWRIEAVRTTEAAAVLGSGIVVLDGDGHMLFLQPKAPKAKKAREIRLSKQAPKLLVTDPTGTGTVWEVSREHGGSYVHPTQKPVELATRAIENSSRPGEIVIDGFSGSGTTLIGCEMTGRRARVIDLDPRYVQAAVERWQKFTGKEATLEGEPFARVAKARTAKRPEKPAGAPKRKGGTQGAPSTPPASQRAGQAAR